MPAPRLQLKRLSSSEALEFEWAVRVGRNVEHGISLTDESASGAHATLTLVDDLVFVEDLGSKNGTFVNDKRISGPVRLNRGDRICFGKEVFEFCPSVSVPTIVIPRVSATKILPAAWANVPWESQNRDGTELFSPEQRAAYLRRSAENRSKRPPLSVSVPSLVFNEGSNAHTVPLALAASGAPEWIIGRDAHCHIQLDDPRVSSFHAKIVREGGKWKLVDAITSNGTYINDLPVGMVYIRSGDALRFGPVECMFYAPPTPHRKSVAPRNIGTRFLFWAAAGLLLLGLLFLFVARNYLHIRLWE